MHNRSYETCDHDFPLSRDPDRACLGGVCAGVARFLGVAPLLIRIAAVAALICLPQTTLVAYGLAFLILDPVRAGRSRPRRDEREFYY